MLPATHERHESSWLKEPSIPPQMTSLPPGRSERLWPPLVSGRSGTEQVADGGNSSTLLSAPFLALKPPTTTCPDAGIIAGIVIISNQSIKGQGSSGTVPKNHGPCWYPFPKLLSTFRGCSHITSAGRGGEALRLQQLSIKPKEDISSALVACCQICPPTLTI